MTAAAALPTPVSRSASGSLRLERIAPLILLGAAIGVYAAIAVATGQAQYLTFDNLIGILGRSIALGITAIGQTFAILVASIDLSVANLISVSAVLASFIMSGDPAWRAWTPSPSRSCAAWSSLLRWRFMPSVRRGSWHDRHRRDGPSSALGRAPPRAQSGLYHPGAARP